MKVAIFGKSFNPDFFEYFKKIMEMLDKREVEVSIYKSFYKFLEKEISLDSQKFTFYNSYKDIDPQCDYMLSIGGDGTFLEAVSVVRNLGIPIVGINSGRLGFMADIAKEEIEDAIVDVFNKNYTIEERSLLQLNSNNEKLFTDFNCALNEFTVHKKDSASMITIHTYLSGEYLNSYWADGLIISTATGSTAYSLSVGGPILAPNSNSFVISPISPHNLTVRPIVIPDYHNVNLRVEGRSDSYLASLDSRSASFDQKDELNLSLADYKVKVLKLNSHKFYDTLRNKLMWGVDKRN
ncbi:MAG: NAD kinase [Marinifilaceae bacterium]|jgi:NAD+ kinase|nr:NAD kinase [Marinifilaceae bacterium]